MLRLTIHGITAATAHGHLAEIALPAGQALEVALLIADVVGVLFGLLAGLELPRKIGYWNTHLGIGKEPGI